MDLCVYQVGDKPDRKLLLAVASNHSDLTIHPQREKYPTTDTHMPSFLESYCC